MENIRASSFIPTPKSIIGRRAIINVENKNDHECFKWSITSVLFPEKVGHHRFNNTLRENSKKLDWTQV